MATTFQSQKAMTTAYPWRRGPEYLQSKSLSVEAPEFVPSWKEEKAACTPSAFDSNCYMISLGAYSDDSSDDEPPSKTPVTTPAAPAPETDDASTSDFTPFRFRRPWRVSAAEFVPGGSIDTSTPAAAPVETPAKEETNDASAGVPWWRRTGCPTSQDTSPVTEQEVTSINAESSASKSPPWRRTSSISSKTDDMRIPATDESDTKARSPSPNGQDSGSEQMAVSTISTCAGTPKMSLENSPSAATFSSVSSCASRSRSSTPPPSEKQASVAEEPETEKIEELEAETEASTEPLRLQALLRWRQASPCVCGEANFCSAVTPEPGTPEAAWAQAAKEAASSSAQMPPKSSAKSPASTTPTSSATPSWRQRSTSDADARVEKSWRSVEAVQKLQVSDDSFVGRQRARRNTGNVQDSESPSNEEVVRSMKSILNKLTIEKFESLSKKLLCCGIQNTVHLELLIQEVFEKATTQHHFIDMYADLCALLNTHFTENPIDPKVSFKKVLLNCCQASFEKNLEPPKGLESLIAADRIVAEQLYKTRMLGNIRFVGCLLVRKMLASKVMLAIMEELLHEPTSEALESLAALLTVIGPTFDTPDWSHRVTLNAIFTQVEQLTKKSSVAKRVRCLLRDVLDIRKSGWQQLRPRKIEGPKKLEEVAADAAGEDDGGWTTASKKSPTAAAGWEVANGPRIAKMAADLYSKPTSPASPAKAAEKTTKGCGSGQAMLDFLKSRDTKEIKEPAQFDGAACKAEISGALKELRTSHDVNEATARIAAIKVPVQQQSAETNDLLVCIVEEGSQETRKVCFGLLAGLFLEGHWKRESLQSGLHTFIEETCPELKCDVPTLPRIVREELQPALAPLLKAKLLDTDQHKALLTGF